MMLLLESTARGRAPSSSARVAGVKGNPIEVVDAIANLHGSGLVHVSGDLVTLSRAARRMDELRL